MSLLKGEMDMEMYKEFNSITDDEIKYIIYDIFGAKVESINRKENNIGVVIKIKEAEDFIEDIIVLTENDIDALDFIVSGDEIYKYEQFLLARGYNSLLRNNKYLDIKI